MVLYPPGDAIHFQIPPGSSSSPISVFSNNTSKSGEVSHRRPYFKAFLNPGDVLFIPPLWLHSVAPLDNVSISVNVFFRNLQHGYAPGRDVYGNRDIQAYEKGRKDIQKILHAFDKIPRDMASVYLERLADEFKAEADHYRREH